MVMIRPLSLSISWNLTTKLVRLGGDRPFDGIGHLSFVSPAPPNPSTTQVSVCPQRELDLKGFPPWRLSLQLPI